MSETDESRLVIAGREGFRDEDMDSVSMELATLPIAGYRSLGEGYNAGDDVRTLTDFVDRYTRNVRSPADDQ